MNYKILVQYDGTRYEGWQRQERTESTIQGKIEAVLSKMCGEEVQIQGAGRTDAGVHAKEQVANVHLKEQVDPQEVKQYLKFIFLSMWKSVLRMSKLKQANTCKRGMSICRKILPYPK